MLSCLLSAVLLHGSEEEDIGSLLDEAAEIATKTKLNIDYQPSVVSVLRAEKLKKNGIRNLHEALGLLPGIETSILHTGWKEVIVRGAYNPDTYFFDKYKLYIDGVDVGSDLYSTSYYYLDFPIELIDRIEVLRGSASTVYGPGAYSGAINVITKSSESGGDDKIFGSTGSYEYAKAGFVKHVNAGGWNIGLDGYFQQANKTLNAGPSFVSKREAEYLRSDYDSLEDFDDFAFGITAKKEDTVLIARYKSEETDNFYGLDESLEPVKGGYQRNHSAIVELQNTFYPDSDLRLESKAGLNYYGFTFDSTVLENVKVGNYASGITFRMNPTYEELRSYAQLELKGQNIKDHEWLAGASLQRIDTVNNELGTTFRGISDGGPIIIDNEMQYLEGEYGFINGDNDQWFGSLYAQDIYSYNDALDFSLNVRLDSYELFGSMTSYRLGAVYRLSDNHIVKAIYGRSYRVPSYIESFQAVQEGLKMGNPDLEPESADTYEIAYTYKKSDMVWRTNIYYSILRNVIDIMENEPADYVGDYGNNRKRTAKGIETEFTKQFENGSELMCNFSYVRTQFFTPDYYTPVEFRSPEISETLFKGYYMFPLNDRLSLNTAWYYSGPKRSYERLNGKVQSYGSTTIIDETAAFDIDSTSSVTFSVKNLFNEKVVYPSYRAQHEGIIREGRNWLLTYEKRF